MAGMLCVSGLPFCAAMNNTVKRWMFEALGLCKGLENFAVGLQIA